MNRFYNTLAALAVILTPVAMMVALGWTAYTALLAETGQPLLSIAAGIATAAAVECIGIVAGETALWFHAKADRRWLLAALILAAYVGFGVVILYGTVLALLPIMAGCVYVLVGLRAQAQRETAADSIRQANGHEWEKEQWRIEQEDRTRVKLARLQAHAAPVASKVQASTNGASNHASTSIYSCKQCEASFTTMQALGAHARHNHVVKVG